MTHTTIHIDALSGLGSWSLAAAPPVAGRNNANGAGAIPIQGDNGAPAGAQAPSGGGFEPFFVILMGMLVVMIMFSVLGGRKEKKRRAEMLSSVKRHDRVQTVGGVIGTVSEVRDDEIVVKVDESTNTKIRFARSAVQQILKSSNSSSSSGASDDEESQDAPEKFSQPEKVGV